MPSVIATFISCPKVETSDYNLPSLENSSVAPSEYSYIKLSSNSESVSISFPKENIDEFLDNLCKSLKGTSFSELQEHVNELRNDIDILETENMQLNNELEELKESADYISYNDADLHERY